MPKTSQLLRDTPPKKWFEGIDFMTMIPPPNPLPSITLQNDEPSGLYKPNLAKYSFFPILRARLKLPLLPVRDKQSQESKPERRLLEAEEPEQKAEGEGAETEPLRGRGETENVQKLLEETLRQHDAAALAALEFKDLYNSL